jgi:hypothetical protein
VFDWQQSHPGRVDRPLTAKHLDLDGCNCMCMKTAVDVFSEAIEMAVDNIDVERKSAGIRIRYTYYLYNALQNQHFIILETRMFMAYCRMFWLSVNCRQVFTSLASAERTILEPLQDVAYYLQAWREEALQTGQPFLTSECYEDAMAICQRWPAFVAYLFNECEIDSEVLQFRSNKVTQDFLESDFGILRQAAGGTRNPPLKGLVYSMRRINENRLNKALYNK